MLMYLRGAVALLLELALALVLPLPTTWWWVLALPYLMPGVLGLIVEVVDAALARMEQQSTEGTHPRRHASLRPRT